MRLLLVFFYGLVLWGQRAPDPSTPAAELIKPVTVCEILADPEAFDGKTVALLGAFTTGPEWWYMVEDCGREFFFGGKEWGNDIWVSRGDKTPAEVKLQPLVVDDKVFHEKFERLRKTTKLLFQHRHENGKQVGTKGSVWDRWAIAYGKIESDRPGYGHLNGSMVRVVVKAGFPIELKEDGSQATSDVAFQQR